jgi:hypothetical protein
VIFVGSSREMFELPAEGAELALPAGEDVRVATVADGRARTASPQPLAEFLRAVHPGDEGCLEIRAFGGDERRAFFVPLPLADDDIKKIEQTCRAKGSDHDLYHAVATRRDASSGRLANCTLLHALFADVDFKDTPLHVAWARIKSCALRPSVVVWSCGTTARASRTTSRSSRASAS